MIWAENSSIYGRHEKYIKHCSLENLKERNHLRDLGIDDRIILKLVLKLMECEGVGWITHAQDNDQWRALVDTAVEFWRFID
jgi:hypothetical protein